MANILFFRMKKFIKATVLAFFMCVVFGIVLSAGASYQSQSSENVVYLPLSMKNYPPIVRQITFQVEKEDENYTWDIMVIDEDGNGMRNLTNDPVYFYDDYYPLWSPNGDKIAFASDRDGYDKIYLVNSDGSQLTRLINITNNDGGYSWSPDGSQLSISSEKSGSDEVYVINADGSNMVPLTNFSSNEISSHMTYWSPTGSQIAFSAYHWVSIYARWNEAYLMNADGSNLENITIGSKTEILSWSPNGTKLLIRSGQNINDVYDDLYVMSLPGHEIIQLTQTGLVAGATWSPDGNQIAFSDLQERGTFIINLDGTSKTEIFCNGESFESYDLVWSPDGAKIAYSPNTCSTSPSGTSCGLYILNLESEQCQHLVEMHANNPQWQP